MKIDAQVRERLSQHFFEAGGPTLSHKQFAGLVTAVARIVQDAEQGDLIRERTRSELVGLRGPAESGAFTVGPPISQINASPCEVGVPASDSGSVTGCHEPWANPPSVGF